MRYSIGQRFLLKETGLILELIDGNSVKCIDKGRSHSWNTGEIVYQDDTDIYSSLEWPETSWECLSLKKENFTTLYSKLNDL